MLYPVQTLVYQFAGPMEPVPAGLGVGTWIPAGQSSVNLLFAEDAERRRRFLRFLDMGAWGIFLVRNLEWVAYGWVTPPGIANPPHLPRWTRFLGAHWIFYCHTRAEHRRKGFYKSLLRQIVDRIRARDESARILCDTLPENFASRRAVLQSGFVPKGVVTSYHFNLPPFGGFTFGGCWQTKEPHRPEMAIATPAARQSAAS